MPSKRSDTTMAKATNVPKGKIDAGAKRRTSTLSIDIGEIKEGHLRLVIKGRVVPRPGPIINHKMVKQRQG